MTDMDPLTQMHEGVLESWTHVCCSVPGRASGPRGREGHPVLLVGGEFSVLPAVYPQSPLDAHRLEDLCCD